MWALLVHAIGADYGAPYGRFVPGDFWSGFGSDLSELAIPIAAYGLLRKHNCHSKGCWRIGRHTVDGSPWCDRHHEAARGESGER